VPLSAIRCWACGLCASGVGVLDRLRFVENHVIEVDAGERHSIATQRSVGNEHQVVLLDLVHPAGPIRTREVEDLQLRREARRFLLPVEQHGPRHNHKRRLPLSPLVLARLSPRVQQREHDDRLAEPHVVGEAAAESELAKKRQPAERIALVGT
jgi:hypothetical protein